jgi:hypothetical protein
MPDFQMEGHYGAFSLTIFASGGGRCRAFDTAARETASYPARPVRVVVGFRPARQPTLLRA